VTEHTDYEVVSPAGRVVYTSPDLVLARKWVSERRDTLPGLIVEEVVTTVVRRTAYRPRLRLVGVA
jgi:hypothetical protein